MLLPSMLRTNQADGTATCNLKMCALLPCDWCWSPEDQDAFFILHCKPAAFPLKWKREVKRGNIVWQWNGELAFFILVEMFPSLYDIYKDSLIPSCGWKGTVDREIGIAITCYKTGMGSTKLEGCPKKHNNHSVCYRQGRGHLPLP